LALTGAGVPIVRRQLRSEPAKLGVTVLAVGAAIALVLLLAGLRRGMGEQVTLYLDRQAPVIVAQRGARNFLSQASVLSDAVVTEVSRVPGVAEATPVAQQYAMLSLHGRPVLALLIGYDPGGRGGPWSFDSGRSPTGSGEVVLDRVLAAEHGLGLDSALTYRGETLRVVGLSSGTSGFMTPLAFATRATVNALSRQPGTANFVFVEPSPGISPGKLALRLSRVVPGISAQTRDEVAARDRRQFLDPFSAPLFAMVAIAFVVAILVIGLAVYGSTVERSREYAMLKALGLRRWPLFRLVCAQAAALAAAGTTLGILLALSVARSVSVLAPEYLVAVSSASVAAIAAGALVVALVAALVPARFVARVDPASALRR
jgi:putative ABC transport system permease protein